MTDPGNEDSAKEILKANRDDFDYPISLSTTNEADLGGHYSYSPERKRIAVNGTRQFPEYGAVTEFEDIAGATRLKPQNSGDVVTQTTTERFRYVVQYVIEWSLSLQTNQSLQSGDIIAVGFGDPDLENTTDNTPGPSADGWFVYANGSMADTEAVLAEYRNGTAVDTEAIEWTKLWQTYGRIAGRTNWYNVGPTTVEETFTGDGTQQNNTVASVSADDGKGPETANKKITASVKAGDGAGSLELEIGSIGVRTLGDVEGIVRTKSTQFENVTVDTTGSYVPIAALRVDPTETVVTTDLSAVIPATFGGTGDAKLVAFVCDPSKTDATGFSTPNELSASGSVLETTTSVDQMPDATGTQTIDPTDPGGYQLNIGTISADRQNTTAQSGRVRKSLIPNSDVVVLAAYIPASGTTGDLTFEVEVEEDW